MPRVSTSECADLPANFASVRTNGALVVVPLGATSARTGPGGLGNQGF